MTVSISLCRSFPGGSVVKDPPASEEDARDASFNPWVRKIPSNRKWQPTPVFVPGKFHGQRSLAGWLQSMGAKRLGHDWAHTQEHTRVFLCKTMDSFFKWLELPPASFLLHNGSTLRCSSFKPSMWLLSLFVPWNLHGSYCKYLGFLYFCRSSLQGGKKDELFYFFHLIFQTPGEACLEKSKQKKKKECCWKTIGPNASERRKRCFSGQWSIWKDTREISFFLWRSPSQPTMLLSTFCKGVFHEAIYICWHAHAHTHTHTHSHMCAKAPRMCKGYFCELAANLYREKHSDDACQGLCKYFIPDYYPKFGMSCTFFLKFSHH